MRNFKSRFYAQVAKFNSISKTTKSPECITALMLMSDSLIDDTQRVSVMAAAAPASANINGISTNYEFLAAITYSTVTSVIKECDKSSSSTDEHLVIVADAIGFQNANNNCDRHRIGLACRRLNMTLLK